MAILVDQARWPWQGTTWCHLVSDSHLDELHSFAGQLGCRRVGFQGDHYDIDIEARELAIEHGAVVCDSRELVRRLKLAGLRLRPSQFTKWQLDYRIDGGVDDLAWGDLLARHPHFARAVALAPAEVSIREGASGCFVLARGASEAVVVHGEGDLGWTLEQPAEGIFVRTDHCGRWAVESFTPPPTPEQ